MPKKAKKEENINAVTEKKENETTKKNESNVDDESDAESESNVDDSEYDNSDDEVENDEDDIDDNIVETAFDDATALPHKRRNAATNNIISTIDKEDEDDIEDNCDEIITTNPIIDEYVDPSQRITFPILTKYEYVRLLSTRTPQLSGGAKMMIKNGENMNPRDVAQYELEMKKMPIHIIRPLPNGKKELWKLSELSLKKAYIKNE